jgi:hypothetical protein
MGGLTLALAVVLGVFGVIIGWFVKLAHRSWQDVRTARRGIAGLRRQRRHHIVRAGVFCVIALALLYALARALAQRAAAGGSAHACTGPTVTASWAGLPLDTEPDWSAPPVGATSS